MFESLKLFLRLRGVNIDEHIDEYVAMLRESVELNDELFNKCIMVASRVFDVPIDKIRSKTRKREAVRCRSFIMKFMYDNSILPIKRIAKGVNRNHASLINSIEKLNDYLEYEKETRGEWTNFLNEMGFDHYFFKESRINRGIYGKKRRAVQVR